MADRKIFAGPRVKRARMALDLSQTAMAKGIRDFRQLSKPD